MLFKTVLSRKNPILKVFTCKLVWMSIFIIQKDFSKKKLRNYLNKLISENGIKFYKILKWHETSIFLVYDLSFPW